MKNICERCGKTLTLEEADAHYNTYKLCYCDKCFEEIEHESNIYANVDTQEFFKEWTSTRPNLKASFHDAGIEAMAFADAYYKHKLSEQCESTETLSKTETINIEPYTGDTLEFYIEGKYYLKICANGDIYREGKLIDNDLELVNTFRYLFGLIPSFRHAEMPLINPDGITIKELKEYVNNLPEQDKYGEYFRLWATDSGDTCLSSPVKNIYPLNKGDLIMETEE